eukprot:2635424-Pyramimonas_sp.AAC.1
MTGKLEKFAPRAVQAKTKEYKDQCSAARRFLKACGGSASFDDDAEPLLERVDGLDAIMELAKKHSKMKELPAASFKVLLTCITEKITDANLPAYVVEKYI